MMRSYLQVSLFSTNGASDVDKVLFLTYLSLLYFLVLCIPTESGGRSVLSPLLSILEIKAMRSVDKTFVSQGLESDTSHH